MLRYIGPSPYLTDNWPCIWINEHRFLQYKLHHYYNWYQLILISIRNMNILDTVYSENTSFRTENIIFQPQCVYNQMSVNRTSEQADGRWWAARRSLARSITLNIAPSKNNLIPNFMLEYLHVIQVLF